MFHSTLEKFLNTAKYIRHRLLVFHQQEHGVTQHKSLLSKWPSTYSITPACCSSTIYPVNLPPQEVAHITLANYRIDSIASLLSRKHKFTEKLNILRSQLISRGRYIRTHDTIPTCNAIRWQLAFCPTLGAGQNVRIPRGPLQLSKAVLAERVQAVERLGSVKEVRAYRADQLLLGLF